MSDLDKINSIFNARIDSVKTKDDLQNIKTEFFGKNGQITKQFKTLGSIEPEKRKDFASNLNKIKEDLTNQINQKDFEISNAEINEKLKNEKASNLILFTNEKFNINALKKNMSNSEIAYVSDLLKTNDTKKNLLTF